MVYTGKPSGGCKTCRQRRIKCDEIKPTCSQCTRSKRECGGYPDPDDLVFQHQTSSTIKKVRRAEARKRSNATTPASDSSDDSQLLVASPAQSVETVAISFYLEGMIVEPSAAGRCMGHLELLPKLYLKAPAGSALSKVTNAVCLAALSNFGTESSPIMRQALEMYGEAVFALHCAMKDPVLRKSNEVLMAVMCMMALEAMLAWHTAPKMQWQTHAFGAVGLLKSRGNQVLDDPVASRIFMVQRHYMRQGSNERGFPLDPFFEQSISDSVRVPDSPEVRLAPITKGIFDLRRRTMQALQNPDDKGTLAVRLNECQWTDECLVDWANNVTSSYLYESTDSPIKLDDLDFNLQEHRYQDTYSHRLWNSYRSARIFCNALAYRCHMAMAEGHEELMECQQNMQTMADEICSSLPNEMRSLSESRPGSPFQGFQSGQQAVLAYFLLWPLFIARGVLTLPESQRAWIRKRMVAIAEKYQIRRLMSLVDVADADETRPLFMESWDDDIIENVWENSFLYGSGAI